MRYKKAVNLKPNIYFKKQLSKHTLNMGLCPIAPPKGFPSVYGARLAHRPLETFGHKYLGLFLKYQVYELDSLFNLCHFAFKSPSADSI